jgi:hypothetical protein
VSPLDDLRAIAPPPARTPPPPDLAAAPLELPSDYAELARDYGPGGFGSFLWLLVPGAANENFDLVVQTRRQLQALREVRDDGEPVPYEPEPIPGGLIPWAITDNGDVGYWAIGDPDDPGGWTVVFNEGRGPDWHAYDGGAVAFLVDWLKGRERPTVFPDDVPYEPETFEPA